MKKSPKNRKWNSVQIASRVAALSATRMGAQPSLPTLKELDVFAKS
jgi:sugar/nucleoside kinase (ribokinase family)